MASMRAQLRAYRFGVLCGPRRGSSISTLSSVRCRHTSTSSSSSKASLSTLLPTLGDLGLKQNDHVHVAMSGGVDSSVVLQILADLPLNLHVVFMRNWDPLLSESPTDDNPTLDLSYSTPKDSKGQHQCEWERDWEDVKRVTDHVGIPRNRVRLVDFTKEYWNKVFEPAIGVWEGGGTPNPDIDCNREIKFGSLMDSIPPVEPGLRHMLATGHYARVSRDRNLRSQLRRAIDHTKDQSYYLSQVTEPQLARSVFPLGGIRKEDVRRLAKYYNLPTADRAESMGVCFIGERGRFGDFISQYTSPADLGYLVTPTGERVGQHRGMWYYTIGQGAKLSGMRSKWFVAKKGVGADGHDILVVPGPDHPMLQCTEASTETFHWISGHPPDLDEKAGIQVQLRHRMKPVPAKVALSPGNLSLSARFQDPIVGVSPGQVLAVYRDDTCLGSGVINSTRTLDQEVQQEDTR